MHFGATIVLPCIHMTTEVLGTKRMFFENHDETLEFFCAVFSHIVTGHAHHHLLALHTYSNISLVCFCGDEDSSENIIVLPNIIFSDEISQFDAVEVSLDNIFHVKYKRQTNVIDSSQLYQI